MGDGSVVRDYFYVGDLVKAIVAAANCEAPTERVLNIGGGQGYSLNKLVQFVESAVGHEACVEYQPGRLFDVPALVGEEAITLEDDPYVFAPADLITIADLAAAIMSRVFETERPERFTIDVEVAYPIFGLRKWQTIVTPTIEWDTIGGGLIITSETDQMEWRLIGFEVIVEIRHGSAAAGRTTLRLTER